MPSRWRTAPPSGNEFVPSRPEADAGWSGLGWAERRRVKVEREVRPDLEAAEQSGQAGPGAAGGGRVNQWGGGGVKRCRRGAVVESFS